MKRLALFLLLLGLTQPVAAQQFSSKAVREFQAALTAAGRFGTPGYTTALLPTCAASNKHAIAYDDTVSSLKVCDGSAWTAVGIASPVAGNFVVTGKWTFGSALDAAGTVRLGETASCVVFEGATLDASETSLCATDPTADLTFNMPNLSVGTYTLAQLSSAQTFTARETFGTAQDAANAVDITETAGAITFEGATADAFEGRLSGADFTVGDQVFTLPNLAGAQSTALAVVAPGGGITQVFTGANAFNPSMYLGNGTSNASTTQLRDDTTQTPDGAIFGLDPTSRALQIVEHPDIGFDFNNGRAGTAAAADPALIVHSRNQSTTQYIQLSSQNATGAGEIQTNLADLVVGGNKATITEASAQAVIRVGIPTSTNVYGMLVAYTIYDISGANYVARTGSVKVQGGNSSGTATCTINTTQDTEAEDGSQIVTSNAATLTYTWTNVVSTTNCDLSLNAASSEGANTLAITWSADVTGNSSAITVTPQ